jgi:hypothetical protein
LVLADLLGAHIVEAPTVDPRYWIEPPETVRLLKADPNLVRILGGAPKSSGEPGYASNKPIDFLAVRDPLDWSLPIVWHIASSRGETPMKAQRCLDYTDHTITERGLLDIQGVSHVVTGRRAMPGKLFVQNGPAGAAFVYRNPNVLPRARLAGRPVYAEDRLSAIAALRRLTSESILRDHLLVEDPSHPLPVDATVSGTARIVQDLPERVVIETDAAKPAYLVLSDTFDPGWSATVDDQPAPIRPAYLAFRAVYLPQGPHTVVFTYRPAGFVLGLELTGCGILLGLILWFSPPRPIELAPDHAKLNWPRGWRTWWFAGLGVIVLLSLVGIGPGGRLVFQSRWTDSVHRFTWGSRLYAMPGYRHRGEDRPAK